MVGVLLYLLPHLAHLLLVGFPLRICGVLVKLHDVELGIRAMLRAVSVGRRSLLLKGYHILRSLDIVERVDEGFEYPHIARVLEQFEGVDKLLVHCRLIVELVAVLDEDFLVLVVLCVLSEV